MGIQISDPFRETELKPKLGMQGRAFFQLETPVALPQFKSGLASLNQI